MKHDFKKMEEEMDLLAKNMSSITEFSGKISTTLQGRREIISKLSGTHSLLKKVSSFIKISLKIILILNFVTILTILVAISI